MSKTDALLTEALDATEAMIASLRLSLDEVRAWMPLTPEAAAALPRINRVILLAFIKSFEQLQDALSRRAARAYLAQKEDLSRVSARDAYDLLEKHGAIADADRFWDMLQLRNRLTHAYPMGAEKQAEQANDAFRLAPALIEEAERLVAHARANGDVS